MSNLSNRDEVWWVDRNKIAISIKSGDTFSGPAAGLAYVIYSVQYDEDFVSSTTIEGAIGYNESPDIPVEFHDALVSGVLEKLYSNNPETIQVAEYWALKYNRSINEAKKYANTARDGTSISIKGYDY